MSDDNKKLDTILSTLDEVKGSLSHIKGRVTKLENATADAVEPGDIFANPDMVADMLSAATAKPEVVQAGLAKVDADTLIAAEKAFSAEADQKLWSESKLKYAGRKLRQHGPGILVGAAMGATGTLAVQRYRASRGGSEVLEGVEPAEPLKMMGGGKK